MSIVFLVASCLFLCRLLGFYCLYCPLLFMSHLMCMLALYCFWEVSLVKYGVVLIVIPMCWLLPCNLLTLCCLLLCIVVEKIIYSVLCEAHKIQIFMYLSCSCSFCCEFFVEIFQNIGKFPCCCSLFTESGWILLKFHTSHLIWCWLLCSLLPWHRYTVFCQNFDVVTLEFLHTLVFFLLQSCCFWWSFLGWILHQLC